MSRAPEAAGHDAGSQQFVPGRPDPLRRQHDFEAVLTAVAGASHEQFARVHGAEWREFERGRPPQVLDDGCRQCPGSRPLHGEHREFAAFVDADFVVPRMLAQPGEVPGAGRSIHYHPEVPRIEVIDDQVVDYAAIRIQHAGIKGLAVTFQLRDVVCKQMPQELPAAVAAQIDDRHVRHVEHSRMSPHRVVFLFLRAVVDGHVPAAEIDHARACGNVLVVQRSLESHSCSRIRVVAARLAAMPSSCRLRGGAG